MEEEEEVLVDAGEAELGCGDWDWEGAGDWRMLVKTVLIEARKVPKRVRKRPHVVK